MLAAFPNCSRWRCCAWTLLCQPHWILPSTCNRSDLNSVAYQGIHGLTPASSKFYPMSCWFRCPGCPVFLLPQGLCICCSFCWEGASPTPCMQWPLTSFRTCLKCYLSKAHPYPCPPSCSISLSCLMFLYFISSYLELYYIFIMLVFIIYFSMRPGLLSSLISVKLLSQHSINIYWPKELGLPGFYLNFILSKISNFVQQMNY